MWQRRLRVSNVLTSQAWGPECPHRSWAWQCALAATVPCGTDDSIPVSAQLVCWLTVSWRIRERPGLRNYWDREAVGVKDILMSAFGFPTQKWLKRNKYCKRMRIQILTVNADSLCLWCAVSYKACVCTIFFPSQFSTGDATLVLRPPRS